MKPVLVTDVIAKGKMNSFFWFVFAICFLTVLADGYNMSVITVTLKPIMKEWKLNPVQAGLLGSWGMFGMIFGSIIFGPIGDKLGKQKALILSTLLFIIFTGVTGFARNFWQFSACRFIGGLGLAGVMPIAMTYISEYSPKSIRSRLTVAVSGGSAAGTIISVLVAMSLIPSLGWRSAYYFALVPIIIVIFQFYLPESMSILVRRKEKEKIAQVLASANQDFKASPEDDYQLSAFHATKGRFRELFQKGMARNTVSYWIVMALSYIFGNGFVLWLPVLMHNQGWNYNFSLFFTLTYHMGFILGVPMGGWMQDKLGGRRTLQLGLFILGVLVSTLGFIANWPLLCAILFLCGAMRHGTAGVTGSYAAQSYPLPIRATGTAWAYAFGRIGGTLGPVATGFLLYLSIPMKYNFMAFSVLLIVEIIAISLTTDYSKIADDAAAATTRAQSVSQLEKA